MSLPLPASEAVEPQLPATHNHCESLTAIANPSPAIASQSLPRHSSRLVPDFNPCRTSLYLIRPTRRRRRMHPTPTHAGVCRPANAFTSDMSGTAWCFMMGGVEACPGEGVHRVVGEGAVIGDVDGRWAAHDTRPWPIKEACAARRTVIAKRKGSYMG